MIEGAVNVGYEAVISLSVEGPTGQTRLVEAVIDTGYSGFLVLPPALATELSLDWAGSGHAVLANDDEAEFDIYDATVLWDGHHRAIEADAAGSTPLVGMLLLEGHSLYMDVVNGGRVVIEAKP